MSNKTLECIRMWCRVANMPDSRMTHRIHKWSLLQGKSWESKMVRLANDLDMANILLVQNPSKRMCIGKAKETLQLSKKGNGLME